MRSIKESVSVYSFVVLIRKEYRNRSDERRVLNSLLERLLEEHHCPIYIAMCKKNNISILHTAIMSELVKPIIFDEYISAGHYLNHIMKQIQGPYCCVLWNDTTIEVSLQERLTQWLVTYSPVCAVPILYDRSEEIIPAITVPAFDETHTFTTVPFLPSQDNTDTLFPFDYIGMYDVERFNRVHGFDLEIDEGYWQLCDFGLSVWLRGLRITSCNGISCLYTSQKPMEIAEKPKAEKRFTAKHFGFRITEKGNVKFAFGMRRRIPKESLTDYISSPAKITTDIEHLIGRWKPLSSPDLEGGSSR